MARLMYDSINPELIPADAELVAGYVSGQWTWSKADWDRFPRAVKIRVDVTGGHPWQADVCDVEQGDLDPRGGADWCLERQEKRGWASAIYCNLDQWEACKAACKAAGATKVSFWIAHWDEIADVLPGSVAHQYFNCTSYDLSAVSPHWFPRSAPGWSVP